MPGREPAAQGRLGVGVPFVIASFIGSARRRAATAFHALRVSSSGPGCRGRPPARRTPLASSLASRRYAHARLNPGRTLAVRLRQLSAVRRSREPVRLPISSAVRRAPAPSGIPKSGRLATARCLPFGVGVIMSSYQSAGGVVGVVAGGGFQPCVLFVGVGGHHSGSAWLGSGSQGCRPGGARTGLSGAPLVCNWWSCAESPGAARWASSRRGAVPRPSSLLVWWKCISGARRRRPSPAPRCYHLGQRQIHLGVAGVLGGAWCALLNQVRAFPRPAGLQPVRARLWAAMLAARRRSAVWRRLVSAVGNGGSWAGWSAATLHLGCLRRLVRRRAGTSRLHLGQRAMSSSSRCHGSPGYLTFLGQLPHFVGRQGRCGVRRLFGVPVPGLLPRARVVTVCGLAGLHAKLLWPGGHPRFGLLFVFGLATPRNRWAVAFECCALATACSGDRKGVPGFGPGRSLAWGVWPARAQAGSPVRCLMNSGSKRRRCGKQGGKSSANGWLVPTAPEVSGSARGRR